MGVLIPVDCAQIAMRWSLAGDSEWMVSTLGVSTPTTDPTPSELAAAVGVAWDASALTTAGNMGAGWSAGTVMVTVMTGTGPVLFEVGTPLAGSGAGTTLPNNCAVLIRKQSAVGGRRGRGRNYLPSAYLPESTVNQVGTIDPAQVSNITTWFGTFWDGLEDAFLYPSLFHSDVAVHTPLLGFTVQPKIATQRTRLRR